ncbi:hypothetical protein RUM43_008650 [Polyplax serrata]|uniref:Uncharacterized protein n=1 Tax=Polyplax serrata TaxID=468196 RepID=A0AAN8PA45_POLSC
MRIRKRQEFNNLVKTLARKWGLAGFWGSSLYFADVAVRMLRFHHFPSPLLSRCFWLHAQIFYRKEQERKKP